MILRINTQRDIAVPGPEALARFVPAATVAWLSFLLLQPDATMVGPTWVEFLRIMPEQSWGMFFGWAGLAGFISLVVPRGWGRATCTTLVACMLTLTARLIYVGHDPLSGTTVPPGAGVYAIIAFDGYAICVWDILVAYKIIQERAFVINIGSAFK